MGEGMDEDAKARKAKAIPDPLRELDAEEAADALAVPTMVFDDGGADEVDWRAYLEADPEVVVGKPVLKNSRLTAEFVLRLCAAGYPLDLIIEGYPDLSAESLRAVFAFAAEVVGEETWAALPLPPRTD